MLPRVAVVATAIFAVLVGTATAETSPVSKHDALLFARGCEHPYSLTTGYPAGSQWSQWNCYADDGRWYHNGDLVWVPDHSHQEKIGVLYHDAWPASRRVRTEGCKRISATVVDCKVREEWKLDTLGYKLKHRTYKCTTTWRVSLENGPGAYQDSLTGDYLLRRDAIATAANCAREIPYPPTGLPVWPTDD